MRFWPNINDIYGKIAAENKSFTEALSERITQIAAAYLIGIFVGVMLAILAARGHG